MTNDVRFTIAGDDRSAPAFAAIDARLKKMEGSFNRAGAAVSRVSKVMGTVFSVAAIRQVTRFVTAQIEAADAIGETADAAGLGAEQMQRLVFAFTQLTNATKAQAEKALQTFNQKLGEAREGSDELQKSAKQLGIDLTQNANVALPQMFRGLAKIDDAGRRAAMAGNWLGDRFGPKLAGALQGSTRALDDAAAAATGIIKQENIDKASKLNDEFQRLEGIFDAEMTSALLENADAMSQLAKWAGELAANSARATAELVKLASNENLSALQKFQEFMFPGMHTSGVGKAAHGATGSWNGPTPGATGSWGDDAAPRKAGPGTNVVTPATDAKAQTAAVALAKARQKIVDDDIRATYQYNEQKFDAWTDRVAALIAESDTKVDEQIRKRQDQIEAISTEIQANLGGAVDELFSTGKLTADAFFESILRDIARVAVQLTIIKPLMEGLFGASAGGTGGGWIGAGISALGSLFGGGKASGGPVRAGHSYLVGENGPEMFTPMNAGNITPNGKMGGNVVNINQTNHIGAGVSRAETAAAMKIAEQSALAKFRDAQRRGR